MPEENADLSSLPTDDRSTKPQPNPYAIDIDGHLNDHNRYNHSDLPDIESPGHHGRRIPG